MPHHLHFQACACRAARMGSGQNTDPSSGDFAKRFAVPILSPPARSPQAICRYEDRGRDLRFASRSWLRLRQRTLSSRRPSDRPCLGRDGVMQQLVGWLVGQIVSPKSVARQRFRTPIRSGQTKAKAQPFAPENLQPNPDQKARYAVRGATLVVRPPDEWRRRCSAQGRASRRSTRH